MKTDPRTRYTKSIIEEVFWELIHDKPISKITVSEICAKAEINRGTFYRYYLDVYDLADRMMDEGLERIRKMLSGNDGRDFVTVFAGVLRMLKEDRKLFDLAMEGSFGQKGQNGFMPKVFRLCFDYLKSSMNYTDDREKTRRFVYVSGGSGALIEYWLRSEQGETAEEIAKIIGQYASRIIEQI